MYRRQESNYPQEKEMQKSKMAVWGGLTNSCEKKRSEKKMKAERQRIDAFELGCQRRLLRVPWTAGRSNLPILKEISPEYSLEGLILKFRSEERRVGKECRYRWSPYQ